MSHVFLPLAEEGRRLLLREAGFALVLGVTLCFSASGLLGGLGILFVVAVLFTSLFFQEPRFAPVGDGKQSRGLWEQVRGRIKAKAKD